MQPSSVELYKFMADLSSRLMKQSDERIAKANKLYDARDGFQHAFKAMVQSAIGLALAEVANGIAAEAYEHARATNQIEELIKRPENKNDDRTP